MVVRKNATVSYTAGTDTGTVTVASLFLSEDTEATVTNILSILARFDVSNITGLRSGQININYIVLEK